MLIKLTWKVYRTHLHQTRHKDQRIESLVFFFFNPKSHCISLSYLI
nr:MAG TPA: hypothetical protein [Caudoviricetes sp.]